jgi:hypothetical protein
MKYHIKKPWDEVPEEKKLGVEFPGHKQVEAAIQRHPVMLRQNHTSSSLRRQNGTAMNPQTPRRRKGTGAHPLDRRRERTPELTPPLPAAPPVPTGNTFGSQCSQIVNFPVTDT